MVCIRTNQDEYCGPNEIGSSTVLVSRLEAYSSQSKLGDQAGAPRCIWSQTGSEDLARCPGRIVSGIVHMAKDELQLLLKSRGPAVQGRFALRAAGVKAELTVEPLFNSIGVEPALA